MKTDIYDSRDLGKGDGLGLVLNKGGIGERRVGLGVGPVYLSPDGNQVVRDRAETGKTTS